MTEVLLVGTPGITSVLRGLVTAQRGDALCRLWIVLGSKVPFLCRDALTPLHKVWRRAASQSAAAMQTPTSSFSGIQFVQLICSVAKP